MIDPSRKSKDNKTCCKAMACNCSDHPKPDSEAEQKPEQQEVEPIGEVVMSEMYGLCYRLKDLDYRGKIYPQSTVTTLIEERDALKEIEKILNYDVEHYLIDNKKLTQRIEELEKDKYIALTERDTIDMKLYSTESKLDEAESWIRQNCDMDETEEILTSLSEQKGTTDEI